MKLYCAWSSFFQNWDRRIINKNIKSFHMLMRMGGKGFNDVKFGTFFIGRLIRV